MVDIEDYPVTLLLVQISPPLALSGEPVHSATIRPWLYRFTCDLDLLRRRYNLTDFATTSLDTDALCRVLAKIAHSYAVTELGLEGFVPALRSFILGRVNDHFRLVGGELQTAPPTANFHEIGLEVDGAGRVIVRIRLFANLGAPVYRVVVGVSPNPGAQPR